MKYSILTLLLSIIFSFVFSPECSAQPNLNNIPPEQYFDFWIGEWDLTWEDPDGTTGTGFNRIERILNDAVIKENFEAYTGAAAGFVGKSYSVYVSASGKWKQTWVDNSGGYLDFTGEFDGNRRMFVRNGINQQGNSVMQRMIFYDIEPDSFTWDWQISEDNGETWQLRWKINYQRAE